MQDKVSFWAHHFEEKGYQVLNYPKFTLPKDYQTVLPTIYRNFYSALEDTDVYFLMNEEKSDIDGYIGASSISELAYVVILNLIPTKNINIYILNIPSEEVPCYDEVKFFLDMGWIRLYKKEA